MDKACRAHALTLLGGEAYEAGYAILLYSRRKSDPSSHISGRRYQNVLWTARAQQDPF